MTKLVPYAGAAGVGFLAAGAVLGLAQPGRDRLAAGFLIAGLVLLAFYLVSRWNELSILAGRRSAREGANAVVLIVVVAGIVVAINYIASRRAKQWDFTAARQYTLSEQTTKILSELETDVEIVLLDNPASSQAILARDLLDLYDNASERVRTSVIDPEAQPERALRFQEPGEPGIELGTVLVVAGERRERATAATEPELTNSLLRALRTDRKKLYFTSGHEEKSLDETADVGLSVMKRKLEASTYAAEPLVIARSVVGGEMKIPEDADAVVVAGPKSDFLPEELSAIDGYLERGGKAVFLVDPGSQGRSDALCAFLEEKGVVLEDDVVVDPLSLPPLYPVVRSYGRHPIVESFSSALSVFPLARSLERGEDPPPGVEIRELFSSEPESWGETRLEELDERNARASDQKQGPLTLAMALSFEASPAEGSDDAEKPGARIVVVGDSDFIANQLASAPLRNADLFLNIVNWVAQDEELISIRPREAEDRRIFLSGQQVTNVLLASLLVIPGVILLTGISVWWGRR